MRALATLSALAALAACAAPEPAAPPEARFTAAAGEIMALTDRCVTQVCADGAAGGLTGVQAIVYVGMRSPSEAVFERREAVNFAGPTRPTGVTGVVVPERPERGKDPTAPLIPPRPAGETPTPGIAEVVVDPVGGAEFGVGDIDIVVEEITPARVVYTVGRF